MQHCAWNNDPVTVNFGCLKPLPEGYSVKWHPALEHYMGHGPGEWETPICWNRFLVRDWVMQKAAERD